jgi:uncharacterized membrane protein HdeD (DUF308 family)
MKDHIPTLALVASLAMILIALVVLSLNAKSGGATPVLIGLVGAVGTVTGILGGFSQHNKTATASQKTTETAIETQSKENTT